MRSFFFGILIEYAMSQNNRPLLRDRTICSQFIRIPWYNEMPIEWNRYAVFLLWGSGITLPTQCNRTLLSKFAKREHVAKNQLENVMRTQPSLMKCIWMAIELRRTHNIYTCNQWWPYCSGTPCRPDTTFRHGREQQAAASVWSVVAARWAAGRTFCQRGDNGGVSHVV